MDKDMIGAGRGYRRLENNSGRISLVEPQTIYYFNQTNISDNLDTKYGVSAGISYFVGCIMIIVIILGLFENATVLFVYTKSPKLRTVNNAFLIGLSLSDAGQTIFNIPLVIIACFSRKWIFGHQACLYIGFVTAFFGLTQITLLSVIALERYFIIVHQSQVLSASGAKASLTILLCFVYGAIWALGPLFGWSEYIPVAGEISCSINWSVKNGLFLSYTVALFVCVWFFPLSVIIYGYVRIACVVYSERAKRSTLRQNIKGKKHSKEKHVAITVLIMISAFVVSWTPYSIVALVSVFGDLENAPSEMYLAPAVFAKASIIWNPIIYIARHREFRYACKQLFNCLFMGDQTDQNNSLTNKKSDGMIPMCTYKITDEPQSEPLMQSCDFVVLPQRDFERCSTDQSYDKKLTGKEEDVGLYQIPISAAEVVSENDLAILPCSCLQHLSGNNTEVNQNQTVSNAPHCGTISNTETGTDDDLELYVGNRENNRTGILREIVGCHQMAKVVCTCLSGCLNIKTIEHNVNDISPAKHDTIAYAVLKRYRRKRRRYFQTLKYHRYLEMADSENLSAKPIRQEHDRHILFIQPDSPRTNTKYHPGRANGVDLDQQRLIRVCSV